MASLDLSRAWNSAATMLKANREVVLVVSGVFFFLPLTGLFLLLLGGDIAFTGPDGQSDPERMGEMVSLFLERYWWALLLVGIAQLVGAIALIRILADPARPSVGEAMASVPGLILPMIGVQLLSGLVIQSVAIVTGAIPGPVGATLSLVALPLVLWLSAKFAIVSPAVVIDGNLNPIKALTRSWTLTKGSSLRIVAFFALLFIAGFILFAVMRLVVGLVLALVGSRGELIGMATFYGFGFALIYTVAYAVIAAIHRQLVGTSVSVPPSGGAH